MRGFTFLLLVTFTMEGASWAVAPTSPGITKPQVLLSTYLEKGSPKVDAVPALEKAIQALGPTGGIVHVPKGNYSMLADRTILIPANITIDCEPGALFSKPRGAKPVFQSTNGQNIYLRGGNFSGPRTRSCFFWVVEGTSHFGMEGCQVSNFASGMRAGAEAGCSDGTLKGNTFEHNLLTGVSLVNVVNLLIQGNHFNSNGDVAGLTHGAYLITTSNVVIRDNEFIGNCSYGLHIYVSHKEYKPFHDIKVVNNVFRDNGRLEKNGGGLIVSSVVDGTYNVDIKQNIFIDNFIGIAVLSVRNYKIENNTVRDSQSYGIYLGEELDKHRNASAIVSGNEVSGSKAEGIRLGLAPAVTGLVIENNDFQDNASGIGIRPRYRIPKSISIRSNGFRGTKDGRSVAPGLVSQDEKQ